MEYSSRVSRAPTTHSRLASAEPVTISAAPKACVVLIQEVWAQIVHCAASWQQQSVEVTWLEACMLAARMVVSLLTKHQGA